MTPLYEVKTKHTKKVLTDFIKFTYQIKYPRVTMNLIVMAVCIGVFAFLARHTVWVYLLAFLSLAVLLFAIFRKQIGVSKLEKADANYRNQSEIWLTFGESEFYIKNPDIGQNDKVRYAEISYMYTNDTYYFISLNNEDLQMIPKADFVLGEPEAFYQFMMDKTGKPMQPTYIPWKTRINLMLEYRDARADEMLKRQEEKKRKKKMK